METLLAILRTAHFAATLSLFGIASFGVFILRPVSHRTGMASPQADDIARRLACAGWLSLVFWLVSLLLWLSAETMSMSGQTLADSVRHGMVATVLTRTQFGHICLLRLVCGILAVPCLYVIPWRLPGHRARTGVFLLIACAAMLVSLAWTGHAGAMSGRLAALHGTADGVHLLAAGAWLGGLPPLAMLYGRYNGGPWSSAAQIATRRFSTLGLICVGGILASGIANACFMVGSVSLLVESEYGRLVLVKIALFAVMVGIAAVNRMVLMPRLCARPPDATPSDAGQTVRHLRRNVLFEIAAGTLNPRRRRISRHHAAGPSAPPLNGRAAQRAR